MKIDMTDFESAILFVCFMVSLLTCMAGVGSAMSGYVLVGLGMVFVGLMGFLALDRY